MHFEKCANGMVGYSNSKCTTTNIHSNGCELSTAILPVPKGRLHDSLGVSSSRFIPQNNCRICRATISKQQDQRTSSLGELDRTTQNVTNLKSLKKNKITFVTFSHPVFFPLGEVGLFCPDISCLSFHMESFPSK